MLIKALVIDDDIFFREIIKDILSDYPIEIFDAGDGEEGLQILKREPIELVITDIIMPEKEGLESIIEILSKYPGVKIIAISGGGSNDGSEYLEMAKSLGAHETLKKPFDNKQLIDSISKVLKRKL